VDFEIECPQITDKQSFMKRFVWMVPVAFALGFAIAWSGKPEDRKSAEASPVGNAANSRTYSREPRAAAQRPTLDRVKGYMRQIEEAASKKDFSSDLLKDVPVGDIPLLIEQWKKRAGFSGLDYNEQSQIKKLITNWYEKEPQAALDWVTNMECKKDRQELVSEIVGAEAKRNLDHALELAKQYGKRELGGLDMPYEIQKILGDYDAPRLMEILRAFPSDDSGGSGSNVAFKENFDFAELVTLLDKEAVENNKQSYSFMPSNLIIEWTKSDPNAAWNWVSNAKGHHIIFNGVDEFFETLAQTRSKEQISAFLVDQMATREDDDSKFRLAWQALSSKPDAAQIADFITRLPGDRVKNLEEMAKASSSGSGGPYDEFKNLLVSQMTVEERKMILPKAFVSNGEASRRMFARTLRQLGHTDAEINEMLPQSKEE
jgi:hypothetical protein